MVFARCDDADRLLSEEAFSVYADCMYRPTYEKYKERMRQYLFDPAISVYVCEEYGILVGLLVLDRSETVTEIVGIAVSRDRRRQGIGKSMLRNAMESENLANIGAQTDGDAIGFYRKCGFRDEKIVIDYPDGTVIRYNCFLYT